jgi:hypothetical protein
MWYVLYNLAYALLDVTHKNSKFSLLINLITDYGNNVLLTYSVILCL